MDVRLGITIDEQEIAGLAADTVILATGARFIVPNDAALSPSVAAKTPAQLLASGLSPKGRVLVCGAGHVGLGVTAWLAHSNTDVTVVCEEPEITSPPGEDGLVERLVATGRVSLAPARRVARFVGSDAVLCLAGAIGPLFEEHVENISLVVWTTPRQPRTELASAARRLEGPVEVYELGDCLAPRDALEAIYEAAVVGRRV